ncbi:MAG: hypothetical protein O2865_15845 [Planctomycetota bacterium]|nr:hypothetical protein [Planctomycetota bacterium]
MNGQLPRVPTAAPGISPLLWCARGTGILMFGLVLGVMHNGDWEGGSPDVTEAFERAFLYVLMASWLVGLRWPSVAGLAGAVGFIGLQFVRWWTTGAPSLEPGVLVTALPSLLYLLDVRGTAAVDPP